MAPLNGERAPTPAPESLITPSPLITPSSPKLHSNKDRGVRQVPAGAPSVDSAVESWESSSAEATGPRSSSGNINMLGLPLLFDNSAEMLLLQGSP